MSSIAPTVTVVIPLADHRGQVFHCLESFVEQRVGPNVVEVVVPLNGEEEALGGEISQRFPGVRLVKTDGLNIAGLYNAGVEAASGRFVYVTEMHCVAEPDCIEAAVAYASAEALSLVSSNSDGIPGSLFSACEQRLFDEDLERWKKSGMGKVTARGFLVERVRWLNAGGLPAEFGHFAEVMLGRRLEASGDKIGYANESLVHHCNQRDPGCLTAELIEYGFDECKSCHFAPPEDEAGICSEWRDYLRGEGRRHAGRLEQWKTRARMLRCRLVMTFCPMFEETYFQAYKENWETAIRLGRQQYVASVVRGR